MSILTCNVFQQLGILVIEIWIHKHHVSRGTRSLDISDEAETFRMSTRTSAVRMSSKGCLPGSSPSETCLWASSGNRTSLASAAAAWRARTADTTRTDCCQVRKEQFHNHFWLLRPFRSEGATDSCKGLEKLQPLCGTSGRHAGRQASYKKVHIKNWGLARHGG